MLSPTQASRSPRPTSRPTRIPLPLALLAAVLLGTSSAHAQTVQGIVIDDSTQQPIGGARLSLLSDSAIAVARTVADSATGMFYLTAPAAGHYRLQIVVGHGGLVISPPFQLDSNQVIEQKFDVLPLPPAMLAAYLVDDVTTPARYLPHEEPPRYPDRLRRENKSGVVRALVVVDSTGRPDVSTFRVLESPHPDFTEAVRRAASQWRLAPAMRDGRAVAEVMPISVDFGFGGEPPRFGPDDGEGIVVRALGVVRRQP